MNIFYIQKVYRKIRGIMRIHIVEHEKFEKPGYIINWALKKSWGISYTQTYNLDKFPDHSSYDLLIIMGGPMGVYEEEKYPWLVKEKIFIKEAVAQRKKIVGVCLGSQLLAEVLGARVFKNQWKEIGFFDVYHTGIDHPLMLGIPNKFTAFHWHGDTFTLPEGAINFFRSDACQHQLFLWDNIVLGLQFHLEVTQELLNLFLSEANSELEEEGPYLQSAEIMKKYEYLIPSINNHLEQLLNNFIKL